MSGHNKWSSIKHKKGAADAKRGKIFTKIIREITVAVKESGPDPETNASLRTCIQKAKSVNMPKDTLDKAILRGAGGDDGTTYTEIIYEGYAPHGVAVMVKCLTDNKNRTVAEMRYIFDRNNGKLGESGCVGYMFENKGVITVPAEGNDEEKVMEIALEAGAEDMTLQGEEFEITTASNMFHTVNDGLVAAGITPDVSEASMLPANYIKLNADEARKVLRLVNALEDNDDVQNVFTNMDVDDEVMEALAEE